ncbi:hypothetical protein JKF63_03855 [Porcisia hertigi]|uniref:Uncharacterized protein n=1 Tax=Porcisia hertigi TaxID=2761500 RepID=A0A836IKX3_9TRYP|nr:hypothetical protein JKF63_03855 [Porcisia hertigi]
MPPHTATGAHTEVVVKPRTAIVFVTSADGSHCLLGLIASTPTTTQENGNVFALVQPRPLILLSPQRRQDEGKNSGLVTGCLVDANHPCVTGLSRVPIPSPNRETLSSSAALPLNADDSFTVLSAEELREMREHRDSLHADLETSKARVREIDVRLQQKAQGKNSSAVAVSKLSPLRGASPLRAHSDAVRRAADAEKAASIAEKSFRLARARLRTVNPHVWMDLQRHRRCTSSQPLINLIEIAAVPLHDSACALFDDVVAQGASLPKRLMAVKSTGVTAEDTKYILRYLEAWPVVSAVEKKHKAAAALYQWVHKLVKATQAQQQVKEAHSTLVKTLSQGSDAARRSKNSTKSLELAPRPANHYGCVEEASLQKERKDQLEYVQMAEEELAAIDKLIAEAETLATSPHQRAHNSLLATKTIVPALMVPTSWVIGALPKDEALQLAAYTEHPCGKPVVFSSGASRMLSRVTMAPASSLAATMAPPQGRLSSGQYPTIGPRGSFHGDNNRSSHDYDTAVPQSTRSRPSTPKSAVPSPTAVSDLAIASAPKSPAEKQLGEKEEKPQLLEARLSAALQQSPKVAEVQLLRDELHAKRTELHRVLEERNKLLDERYERRLQHVSSTRRFMTNGAPGDGTSEWTSEQHAGQSSTPREIVHRRIVEELEDQLTAAHQRISELLMEASQSHRQSPTLTGSIAALKAVQQSSNGADMQSGRSQSSAYKQASIDEIENSLHFTSDTLKQPSPKSRSASPSQLYPAMVTQQMYDDLEACLRSVSAELETKQQQVHRLEEQLNEALHCCIETEHIVSAQKQELQEVWERLEAAEARAEEKSILSQQRLLLDHSHASPQPQQQQPRLPSPLHPSFTLDDSHLSQYNEPTPNSSSAQTSYAHPTLNKHDVWTSGPVSGVADAEMRPQSSEDIITTTANANTPHSTASGQSTDARTYSSQRRGDIPTFVNGSSGATAALASSTVEYLPFSPYSVSASLLHSRPVEQLSMIELRHEVHHLREEVERHQSVELRFAMELQTLREKQKAEGKRRRDARSARFQMLTRMQCEITDFIEQSMKGLEEIPTLLERSRVEADALTARRQI